MPWGYTNKNTSIKRAEIAQKKTITISAVLN